LFHTIDSALTGPYPERIELAINQVVNALYQTDPLHYVVLATRYTPENGVDFSGRWPKVYTLLQRNEDGDMQMVFTYRDEAKDLLVIMDSWLLAADEIHLAWLSYPYE